METTFGEFIKTRRIAKRITLRAFSGMLGYDPANYSRMERGLTPPPTHPDKLAAFARVLEIAHESEEYREMARLASLGRGEIPQSLLSDQEVLKKLPLLFRTLEGDPIDDTLLDGLYELLKKESQPCPDPFPN